MYILKVSEPFHIMDFKKATSLQSARIFYLQYHTGSPRYLQKFCSHTDYQLRRVLFYSEPDGSDMNKEEFASLEFRTEGWEDRPSELLTSTQNTVMLPFPLALTVSSLWVNHEPRPAWRIKFAVDSDAWIRPGWQLLLWNQGMHERYCQCCGNTRWPMNHFG